MGIAVAIHAPNETFDPNRSASISRFARGDGKEGFDNLPYIRGPAFWTADFFALVLLDSQYLAELVLALVAPVFIQWHGFAFRF